ncbi:uncharacterized protein LOC132902739 [Amyelois transitella]|uniref:uncharacterized protein LOC132902739 n=1 Tax=Amyelois transitella TaxID=680683 RepID=UPI0029906D3B|nr:uncharacterized protein LOC132902739 [Amyelois transitella]
MSWFTIRELAIIAIALDEEEKENSKKKRKRYWVHSMNKARSTEGEFRTIKKHLMDDEEKFYIYFHMPKYLFYNILQSIDECIRKKNTTFRETISPEEKLAVTLRYFITGSTFTNLSSSFRLGESTIRLIVIDVCNAIINKLMPIHIPQPTTATWQGIEEGFKNKWNFPNCIGAIDGKHVNIIAPPNSGSLFFNYKKTFSIVLLAIVDPEYRFIAVDVGAYGKNSDGGIYSSSTFGKALERNTFNIPCDKPLPGTNHAMPHVFVGDEAFPLKTYLLRPYPRLNTRRLSDPTDTERQYNYRLSRARRVVENAFGILYQKFAIYNKNIKLHPKFVDKVVLTTCILHNMMRTYNIEMNLQEPNRTEQEITVEFGEDRLLSELPSISGAHMATAFNVREKFKTYFQTSTGRVPWQ